MVNIIRRALTTIGVWTASPIAFGIVLLYAVSWFSFERDTFDWHAIATLATWLMTLVIQRAEHRDTQAIHTKLDELLHIHGEARDDHDHKDDREPADIGKQRT